MFEGQTPENTLEYCSSTLARHTCDSMCEEVKSMRYITFIYLCDINVPKSVDNTTVMVGNPHQTDYGFHCTVSAFSGTRLEPSPRHNVRLQKCKLRFEPRTAPFIALLDVHPLEKQKMETVEG